jgi:hypothetical protein
MFFVSLYCGRGIDFGCCADARDKAIELFLECDVLASTTESSRLKQTLAPAGGAAAAAPEGGALACPSAPTSTSARWALVTP